MMMMMMMMMMMVVVEEEEEVVVLVVSLMCFVDTKIMATFVKREKGGEEKVAMLVAL